MSCSVLNSNSYNSFCQADQRAPLTDTPGCKTSSPYCSEVMVSFRKKKNNLSRHWAADPQSCLGHPEFGMVCTLSVMQCWYGDKAVCQSSTHTHTKRSRCFAKKKTTSCWLAVDLLIISTALWSLSAVRGIDIFAILPQSVDEKDIWEPVNRLVDILIMGSVVESHISVKVSESESVSNSLLQQ